MSTTETANFDLRGKDYFTQTEAMHYVGLRSKDTFRREYGHLGFYSGSKLLYRRVDIIDIIEANRLQAWQHCENEVKRFTSAGTKTAKNTAAHLAR